jgi:hypothetical protein
VILAVALVLRFNALDRFLPHATEPDNDVVHQVYVLDAHMPAAERPGVYARYPLLTADLARLIPSRRVPADGDLAAHMRAAHDVTLRLRTIAALSGACLVLATWFLARRFASSRAALFAAFFVATSLLHILFSQQARPHALHATLSALAVLTALRLRERPTTAAHLLAGAAAGLSAACLQSGLATFVPLAAALVLRERSADGGWGDRGPERDAADGGASVATTARRAILALLALALAAGLTIAFEPGATQPEYDGTHQDLDLGGGKLRFGGHEIVLAEIDGSGFARMARFLWDHDPVIAIAAAIGLLACAMRWRSAWRRKSVLIVIAYVVPYSIALGLYRQTFDRFLLPLLPYLACLAGIGVERAMRFAGAFGDTRRAGHVHTDRTRRLLARGASIVIALVFLALPSLAALRFARVCRTRDTIERAADWLASRADARGATILVTPGILLPLFYDAEALEHAASRSPSWYAHMRWIYYQSELPRSLAREPKFHILDIPPALAASDPASNPDLAERSLASFAPTFVVLENSPRMLFMPGASAIADLVRRRGELVWTVGGEHWGAAAGDPDQRPFEYQDISDMVWRLFHLDRLGPPLEIYRLK